MYFTCSQCHGKLGDFLVSFSQATFFRTLVERRPGIPLPEMQLPFREVCVAKYRDLSYATRRNVQISSANLSDAMCSCA